MERKKEKELRLCWWKLALGIALALVLLTLGTWYFLFRFNRFSLSLELIGESHIQLEYGETYEEAGAHAMLRGTRFFREGFTPDGLEVTVTGRPDETTLGRYCIIYSVHYQGLSASAERVVDIVDTQCPVIILKEDPEGSLGPGQPYREAGYTATDNYDGDITDKVIRIESLGSITYSVIDSSGNPYWIEREIPYYDPIAPAILLEGGEHYRISVGKAYQEPGFTATDNVDGDLTAQTTVEGEVDCFTPGTYPITYTASDTYGNVTTVVRQVEVAAQPWPDTVWPEGKVIYLTFDDGPGPYTTRLLNVLDHYGIKATFFVTDTGYDAVMADIVARGHSIGIHTVSHNYGEIYSSPEAYFQDLYRMQEIIYENTGVRTTLMRFPGGSSNMISIKSCEGIMTILTRAVRDAGFQYFDWNVDSNDAGGAVKSSEVRYNVIDGASQTRVSVVLQHDIHSYSVDAVEDIIIWGLDNGYTFLPLKPESPGFHHGVHN